MPSYLDTAGHRVPSCPSRIREAAATELLGACLGPCQRSQALASAHLRAWWRCLQTALSSRREDLTECEGTPLCGGRRGRRGAALPIYAYTHSASYCAPYLLSSYQALAELGSVVEAANAVGPRTTAAQSTDLVMRAVACLRGSGGSSATVQAAGFEALWAIHDARFAKGSEPTPEVSALAVACALGALRAHPGSERVLTTAMKALVSILVRGFPVGQAAAASAGPGVLEAVVAAARAHPSASEFQEFAWYFISRLTTSTPSSAEAASAATQPQPLKAIKQTAESSQEAMREFVRVGGVSAGVTVLKVHCSKRTVAPRILDILSNSFDEDDKAAAQALAAAALPAALIAMAREGCGADAPLQCCACVFIRRIGAACKGSLPASARVRCAAAVLAALRGCEGSREVQAEGLCTLRTIVPFRTAGEAYAEVSAAAVEAALKALRNFPAHADVGYYAAGVIAESVTAPRPHKAALAAAGLVAALREAPHSSGSGSGDAEDIALALLVAAGAFCCAGPWSNQEQEARHPAPVAPRSLAACQPAPGAGALGPLGVSSAAPPDNPHFACVRARRPLCPLLHARERSRQARRLTRKLWSLFWPRVRHRPLIVAPAPTLPRGRDEIGLPHA